MTQSNFTAYALQLQSLLSDWNSDANDLSDGDLGLQRGKVERAPRAPTTEGSNLNGGKKGKGKKRKNYDLDEEGNEVEYQDGEEFEVEAIVGTRISAGPRADKSERFPKGTQLYRIVWKGFAASAASWEPASGISDDLLAEYEAGLDAEAELDAEEERELQEEADAEAAGEGSGEPMDTV